MINLLRSWFLNFKSTKSTHLKAGELIWFDKEFQDKYNDYKGLWLMDEAGVHYILNYYHLNSFNLKTVKSLEFKTTDGSKTVNIKIEGEKLYDLIKDDWKKLGEWCERQSTAKNSLNLLGYTISKTRTKTDKKGLDRFREIHGETQKLDSKNSNS